MKVLNTKTVASVELAEVEISIDEIEVFDTALNFALASLDEAEIYRLFGASRDELEGIIEDLEKLKTETKASDLEPILA